MCALLCFYQLLKVNICLSKMQLRQSQNWSGFSSQFKYWAHEVLGPYIVFSHTCKTYVNKRFKTGKNIPSLPPFKVISDEKLVEDLEPRESKLSKESSLLWLVEDEKASPRSTYQISPYPLSLPLLFRWLDSSSAYESKFGNIFCNNIRCKCYL